MVNSTMLLKGKPTLRRTATLPERIKKTVRRTWMNIANIY